MTEQIQIILPRKSGRNQRPDLNMKSLSVPQASAQKDAAAIVEGYGPPAVISPKKSRLLAADGKAYDSAFGGCADVESFLFDTGPTHGTPHFIGYAACAHLEQDGFMRLGVEGLASEMTREWMEIKCPDADLQKLVTYELKALKIRRLFRHAASTVGYYGSSRFFIDTGTRDPEELATPLILEPWAFKPGDLRGFIHIDPALMFPVSYNANDPLSPHFYKPTAWFALSRNIHASRFLHFVQNEPKSIYLKPVYNFGGIPQVQLALDALVHFTGSRESAARLLKKFSLTVFKTDMNAVLYGGDDSDVKKRLQYFAYNRDNDGVEMIDMEAEDIIQINTPLAGVTDQVRQALEMLAAVFHMPVTKFLGISPGGMNATGESDMRNWYDYASGQQIDIFDTPMAVVAKLAQLNATGRIDPALTHEWHELQEPSEAERATINKTKADTLGVLQAAGYISPKEGRAFLSADEKSGFAGIDPEDLPPPPEGDIDAMLNEYGQGQ